MPYLYLYRLRANLRLATQVARLQPPRTEAMMNSLEGTILHKGIVGECEWEHPEVQAFLKGFLLECPNRWNLRSVRSTVHSHRSII